MDNATRRQEILNKANNEFVRLCGFDLIQEDEYLRGVISLDKLLSINHQWMLDHVDDTDRSIRHAMRRELDREHEPIETGEQYIRRVTSDLMPTPEHKK